MSYSGVPRPFGVFENPYDSSEDRIVDAVKNVVGSIEVFLQKGREAICEELDSWISSFFSEEKKNDIYAYFAMPLINPYSDAYILEKVEEWYNAVNSLLINLGYYGIFYILYRTNAITFDMNTIILMFGFGMVVHYAVSLIEEKVFFQEERIDNLR